MFTLLHIYLCSRCLQTCNSVSTLVLTPFVFAERPLHYTENVLEQVLQWSSLAEPGSAYLVVKRFLTVDSIKQCRGEHASFTLRRWSKVQVATSSY